jgi:hypothetical protein
LAFYYFPAIHGYCQVSKQRQTPRLLPFIYRNTMEAELSIEYSGFSNPKSLLPLSEKLIVAGFPARRVQPGSCYPGSCLTMPFLLLA